jgi:hypothetical protein
VHSVCLAFNDKFSEDDSMVGHFAHISRPEFCGSDGWRVNYELLGGFVEGGRGLDAWHERTMPQLSLGIAASHLE